MQNWKGNYDMINDYLQSLLNMEKLCHDFEYSTKERFFTDSKGVQMARVSDIETYFCFTPAYRKNFDIIKRIVDTCDIFGIKYLERNKERLVKYVHLLEEHNRISYRSYFEEMIKKIRTGFNNVKNEIKEKISLLNPAEIDRVNEAIHCFLEGCYYSSVAMSVHAIEFRLFSLMMSICPDPKLEELTLGQLIGEYLDDKQKYGSVIPKKHEPLLDHCNTYRIFSVHPKKEEINKLVASSILNMTFLFLLDKKLAKKAEEAKVI
jgi:hypothetical protein